jgi:hypothetical protein
LLGGRHALGLGLWLWHGWSLGRGQS